MIDDIDDIITRFDTVEALEDLKEILSSCCRILVDALDLEMCLVLFHEVNPILDTFVVTVPESEYKNYDAGRINGIEKALWDQNKPMTVIPMLAHGLTKKIGALLLVQNKVSAIEGNVMEQLKELMAKCAASIRKLSLLKGNTIYAAAERQLINYAHEVVTGKEKTNEIIFNILKELDVPTRVFIASELEDGSYTYYHALAEDGRIVDYKEATIDKTGLAVMIKEIKRNEPGHWEIDIDDNNLVKSKLIVGFEKSGSIFDGDVEEILWGLSPNLAGLMIFNHPRNKETKEESDADKIQKDMLEGIGKRLRVTRDIMRFSVEEMCILLDTTRKRYLGFENGEYPLNLYKLTVLKYIWLVDLDWLLHGKEKE